ncbi:MAG TPA: hypothetical protein VM123_09485 [archaeon]|nr:hypothetical protein [archaeon]
MSEGSIRKSAYPVRSSLQKTEYPDNLVSIPAMIVIRAIKVNGPAGSITRSAYQ